MERHSDFLLSVSRLNITQISAEDKALYDTEAEGISAMASSEAKIIIISIISCLGRRQHCHSPQALLGSPGCAAIRTIIRKGKHQFVLNLSLSQLPAHNSE